MKRIRAYKAIPPRSYAKNASRVQGIIEPDRDKYEKVFKEMLAAKDPLFLKRATHMIVQWDRTTYPPGIVHIHGNKDNTLPYKHVKANYTIEEGSHMMALTRSDDIFKIIIQKFSSAAQSND
jgi:hypothetical protein